MNHCTVRIHTHLSRIGKGVLDKLRRDESFEASQVELGARLDSSNPNTILTSIAWKIRVAIFCVHNRFSLPCLLKILPCPWRSMPGVLPNQRKTRSFVPGLLHRTARVNTSLDSMQADRVVTRFGEFQKE
jgi:hypothetical protein